LAFDLVTKRRQFGGGGNWRHQVPIAPRAAESASRLRVLLKTSRPIPMTERPNGLTYAQAGVDIDAGNALIEAIKPLARATRRPGADAALGGFGALFDLKAA